MSNNLNNLNSSANESWRDNARCKESKKTDIFFSQEKKDILQAKEICNLCEVKVECLNYAIDYKIDFGVWGGHTTYERNRSNKLSRNIGILSLRVVEIKEIK